MNMNVYGIEGLWNLIWIIPLCIGIGFFISAFWPFGKGFEGPPYVGFDPGKDVTGRTEHVCDHRCRENGHYEYISHRLALREYPQAITGNHPNRPCSPQCWRKPDGHRWGDEH